MNDHALRQWHQSHQRSWEAADEASVMHFFRLNVGIGLGGSLLDKNKPPMALDTGMQNFPEFRREMLLKGVGNVLIHYDSNRHASHEELVFDLIEDTMRDARFASHRPWLINHLVWGAPIPEYAQPVDVVEQSLESLETLSTCTPKSSQHLSNCESMASDISEEDCSKHRRIVSL
mmetsp:Transcript_14198/g.28090  ORF Transcript_14198/g.28090 Transcript_14198/m.28090 type:complete len:175 (-) Transcript_14198:24-548(-)